MLKFLPVGFVGLMVGGLIAANSSTILTHLNWGASYLVHDFYQRFIRKNAPEKHYVLVGRLATVLLFLLSSATVYLLESAKDAFDVILQIGAGTGLLYLVRWFWWRVNAWCEVVAMVSSFLVSLALLVLARNGVHFSTHVALLLTIAVTTVCWVATAYVGPQTDRARARSSSSGRSGPFGPGWQKIREEAGLGEDAARTAGDNIPLALLGWFTGCTTIWSALFTVGNFLYGRTGYALVCLAMFTLAGVVLICASSPPVAAGRGEGRRRGLSRLYGGLTKTGAASSRIAGRRSATFEPQQPALGALVVRGREETLNAERRRASPPRLPRPCSPPPPSPSPHPPTIPPRRATRRWSRSETP